MSMLSVTALKSAGHTSRHRIILLCGQPAILADEIARMLLSWWKMPVLDVEDIRECQIDTVVPVCLRIDPADDLDVKALSALRAGTDNKILIIMRSTAKLPKGLDVDMAIECGPLNPTGSRFAQYVEQVALQAGLKTEPEGIDSVRVSLGGRQDRIAVEMKKLAIRGATVLSAVTARTIDVDVQVDADALVDLVIAGDRKTALLLALSWLDRTDVLLATVSMLASRLRLAKAWANAQDHRMNRRDFGTRYRLAAFRFEQIDAAVPAARQRFDRIVSGLCLIDQTVRTRSDIRTRFDAVLRGVMEMT